MFDQAAQSDFQNILKDLEALSIRRWLSWAALPYLCTVFGIPALIAITLEAVHAVDALQEAYRRFGKPDIVNTDQGSQFTAQEFVDAVLGNEVKLSMDGRGAWRDNVFVERIWRSVKYERVYLRAYGSVAAARTDIAAYIDWYNFERGHSSLEDKTPEQVWLAGLPLLKEAA